MRIIVTGGAGFIGSHFIDYVLDAHPSYEIVCIDKLTYAANPNNLINARAHANFSFYKADICDKRAIDQLFENSKPDAVINFAAETHVDRSIENSSPFFESNVLGMGVLLDCCLKHGVNRFHQISTDEVYGDTPLCSTTKFDERSPLNPSSPYSASKASADLIAMAYGRTHGLYVTISRSSNNYGPRQFEEKLIPLMIKNALENKKLGIYGDGNNVRDWIYVKDHAKAIDEIVHHGERGHIYNVGANCLKTNNDIVKAILDVLDKPYGCIEYIADRKGHDLRYALNTAKICSELGWRAETDFENGLSHTINWYLEYFIRQK